MGTLTNMMGRLPRLMVLEAFAENPFDTLSAPEIEEMTGVSRRSAYLIVKKLTHEGILIRSKIKDESAAITYSLNPNDIRSKLLPRIERLLTIGMIESELKQDMGLEQADPYPYGLLNQGRIPIPLKSIEIHEQILAGANFFPPIERMIPSSTSFALGQTTNSQNSSETMPGSAT